MSKTVMNVFIIRLNMEQVNLKMFCAAKVQSNQFTF